MIYGFEDKKTAKRLQKLGEMTKTKALARKFDAGEVSPRIYAAQTAEEMPPLGLPAEETGEQAAEKKKVRKIRTSLDGSFRPHDFLDGTPEEMRSFSVSRTNISENVNGVMVSDGFNQNIFLPETPSEVFGKLESAYSPEKKDEPQTVRLDDGFLVNGEDSLDALCAPTISGQSFDAETAVCCRFNTAAGKWFFFAPNEGGGAAVRVTASGTALGGFGIHDGKRVWACTLAAGSLPVDVYSTPAVEEQKTAYFFDGKECWVPLPVAMTDFYGNLISDVAEVAGDLFRSAEDGRIYKKEDFGTVYTAKGLKFLPTFQRLNNSDVWKSEDGTYIYYDRQYWVVTPDFGYIVADPDTEARDFSSELSDVAQLFSKPYWESGSGKFGIYEPKNGAAGTVQLGSEWWTGPQNAEFFQIPELDDNENFQYSGEMTIGGKVFSGIHWDGSGVWILGTKNAPDGWYEAETFSKDSSPAVFRFRHESETAEDIQLEFQGYAAGNFTRPVLMIQPGIMT